MNPRDLSRLLLRDLDALTRELRKYPDSESVWRAVPGVPNTAGTLALHLCGNLRHFTGACLGGTGYVRDRDAEFARRDAPVDELLAGLAQTRTEVAAALEGLDPAAMNAPFPVEFGGARLSTGLFLAHLATHLAFHLGQIDYHRRMVTGDSSGVGAVGIPQPDGE